MPSHLIWKSTYSLSNSPVSRSNSLTHSSMHAKSKHFSYYKKTTKSKWNTIMNGLRANMRMQDILSFDKARPVIGWWMASVTIFPALMSNSFIVPSTEAPIMDSSETATKQDSFSKMMFFQARWMQSILLESTLSLNPVITCIGSYEFDLQSHTRKVLSYDPEMSALFEKEHQDSS